MRSARVEVSDVLAKCGLKVTGAENDDVVEAFEPSRAEPRNRSHVVLTSGEPTGHLTTRVPTAKATRSKSAPNFAVSIANDETRGHSPNGVAVAVQFLQCRLGQSYAPKNASTFARVTMIGSALCGWAAANSASAAR